jgi:hypothetical protein
MWIKEIRREFGEMNLMAARMKMAVLCDDSSCSPADTDRCFTEAYYLHH